MVVKTYITHSNWQRSDESTDRLKSGRETGYNKRMFSRKAKAPEQVEKDGERMDTQDRVRNVSIQLHSLIRHPGQEQEMHELSLAGQFIEKKGKSYLKYEEQQNGTVVRTTVKLDAEDALILRSGAVTMRLPFSANDKRPGTYGNGPASFNLLVETDHLEFITGADESTGRFHVAYHLHAEGSLLGTYELTITYTEGIL